MEYAVKGGGKNEPSNETCGEYFMIPSASEFLGMMTPGKTVSDFIFATIDPDYTGGNPKVLFDGEETLSSKTYPFLSSYSPVAGDRVSMIKVSGSYLILGKFDGTSGAASGYFDFGSITDAVDINQDWGDLS